MRRAAEPRRRRAGDRREGRCTRAGVALPAVGRRRRRQGREVDETQHPESLGRQGAEAEGPTTPVVDLDVELLDASGRRVGEHGADQVVILGDQIIRHEEREPRDGDGGGGERLLGAVEEAGVAGVGLSPPPGLPVLLRQGASSAVDEVAGIEVGGARRALQSAPPRRCCGLPGGCVRGTGCAGAGRRGGQTKAR